jgi:hypothetical protein
MARKNPNKWSTIALEKSVIKKLNQYKVHPNQSINEIIKNHLEQKEVKNEDNRNA